MLAVERRGKLAKFDYHNGYNPASYFFNSIFSDKQKKYAIQNFYDLGRMGVKLLLSGEKTSLTDFYRIEWCEG
jgi:hypothetical protein